MSEPQASDSLGRPLRAALELFEEALPEVRFPDASAELLRAKASSVAGRADAVRAAREALAEAEAALAEERAAFAELVGKALAYARIYAEGRPEIAERLAALGLGEPAAEPKKKRGRPRKRPSDEPSASAAPPPALPFESAGGELPSDPPLIG